MLIEALFVGVLSSAAPQVAPVNPSAPIVLCDEDHGKKSGETGKDEEKKDESKPAQPKPSYR